MSAREGEEWNTRKKGLIAIMPNNLSYEEAAVIPAGALTALKSLQKAKINKDQKILINGASGSLGTYSIQLAKYFGAEVTCVCSKNNFDLMESLGVDKMIDYQKEEFTKIDNKYDVVYDAVMKSDHSQCKNILNPNGIFLNNNHLPKITEEDLLFVKDLVEKNRLRPVIDKTYTLNEVVEAHRYVDTGHKKGNVAITV